MEGYAVDGASPDERFDAGGVLASDPATDDADGISAPT